MPDISLFSRPAWVRMTTALGAGLISTGAFAQDQAIAPTDDSVVLDEVVITAAPATETEGSDSWTTEWMRSATGLVLSQKETPQSTSAITSSQLKDRGITTIAKAMDAATGITVQAFESDRINYYSRGFQVNAYQYDSVPVPKGGAWEFGENNPDMALYDHIEIVRGATGLMQGAGEPGASVNFVRKRPTQDFQNEAAVALAYPNGARVESDVSGPLNASGSVRGRLISVYDSRDGSLDRYHKKKYVLYGTVEADLTENTLLRTGISFQRTDADNVTWGGLAPRYSDGGLIDWAKGASTGQDWTYVNTRRTEAFASLEHVFDNGWTGRFVISHMRTKLDTLLAWVHLGTDADGEQTILPDRATGAGMEYYGRRFVGDSKQTALNAQINGDFQAFGRSHQFVIGAMASDAKAAYDGSNNVPDTPINIHDLNGKAPRPIITDNAAYTWANSTRQYGIYGSGRFSVTDQLAVIGGARVNWWKGDQGSRTTITDDYSFSGEVTPYLGFTWDVTPIYTAYGSITSIYQPSLSQDINRKYLPPTYGWNYELGVKGDLMNGALFASAAIFQTDQKDVAQYVRFIDAENRSVYESIDGTTTRGFELEAAGAINERWNISGGYTYRVSKDKDGNKLYLDQPKHTLKLATDYRLAGFQDKLTVGGAMRWQSGTDSMTFESDANTNVHQASYAVFDLNAAYALTDKAELSLNVNNIFDKKYYATTGFYDTVVYGDTRSAELTLRTRF